jgi:hypothetical protein
VRDEQDRVRRVGAAAGDGRRRACAAGHPETTRRAGRTGHQPQPAGRNRLADHRGVGTVATLGSAGKPALLHLEPAQAAWRLAVDVGKRAAGVSAHGRRHRMRHRPIRPREDRGRAGGRRGTLRAGQRPPDDRAGRMARTGSGRPARLSVRRRVRHRADRGQGGSAHRAGGGRNRLRAWLRRYRCARIVDGRTPTASRCGRN